MPESPFHLDEPDIISETVPKSAIPGLRDDPDHFYWVMGEHIFRHSMRCDNKGPETCHEDDAKKLCLGMKVGTVDDDVLEVLVPAVNCAADIKLHHSDEIAVAASYLPFKNCGRESIADQPSPRDRSCQPRMTRPCARTRSGEIGVQLTGRLAMKASRSLAAFAPHRYCELSAPRAQLSALGRVDAPKPNASAANFQRVAVDDAGLPGEIVGKRTEPEDQRREHAKRCLDHAAPVLYCTSRHDLQRVVRQRPLRCLGLIRRRAHANVVFFVRGQDHRHGPRMDWLDNGVRCRRQEAIDEVRNGSRASRTEITSTLPGPTNGSRCFRLDSAFGSRRSGARHLPIPELLGLGFSLLLLREGFEFKGQLVDLASELERES